VSGLHMGHGTWPESGRKLQPHGTVSKGTQEGACKAEHGPSKARPQAAHRQPRRDQPIHVVRRRRACGCYDGGGASVGGWASDSGRRRAAGGGRRQAGARVQAQGPASLARLLAIVNKYDKIDKRRPTTRVKGGSLPRGDRPPPREVEVWLVLAHT
jgi:hypothetical protein